MPTYVYKFTDTDETIEVQQSFSDATLTEYTHPETGATMPVKKVFLPVGVTFKGDGFYKTDSRAATKKSKGSAGGDAPSSESSKSDSSKSESSKSDSSKSDSSKSESSKSESSKSESSKSESSKSESSKSTTSSSSSASSD